METDSHSLTPPYSPALMDYEDGGGQQNFQEQESDPEVAPCFNCRGDVSRGNLTNWTPHPDSFLARSQVSSLLNGKDPCPTKYRTGCCVLFNSLWSAAHALEDHTDQLFYMLRQQIMTVQNASRMNFADGSVDFVSVRAEIAAFFQYVSVFLHRWTDKNQEHPPEFLPRLLANLKAIVLHVGADHEHPVTSQSGNKCQVPSYHSFHLQLEVLWWVTSILHQLSASYHTALRLVVRTGEGENSLLEDPCSQCLQLLLTKLLQISLIPHAKVQLSECFEKSPFSCACVRELWVMYVHLVAARHKQYAKQSLWTMLYSSFQDMEAQLSTKPEANMSENMESDCDVLELPPVYNCREIMWYTWWLLYHIAPLVKFDADGRMANTPQVSVSPTFVPTLLKSLFKKAVTENMLRLIVAVSVSTSREWGPSVDVVCAWWDSIYRKINESFSTTNTIIRFTVERLTPASQVSELQQLHSSNYIHQWLTASSYQGFLYLLSQILTTSPASWKPLKGRFYSKFHPRRLMELSETGLATFTQLFVTLALAADTPDVVKKFSDLVSSLDTSAMSSGRVSSVLNALFALMLVAIQKNCDITKLADAVVNELNHLHRQQTQQTERCHDHEVGKVIQLILTNIQEVMETSTSLSLSQYKLLAPCLGQRAPHCKTSELHSIINLVQTVISKLRSSEDPQDESYIVTADQLWGTFYPFIKEHACTLTPPPQLADVAAGFTLLLMERSPGPKCEVQESLSSAFQYFGTDPKVSTSLSCRYLCHLLPNDLVMEKVRSSLPQLDSLLVRAWFSCVCRCTEQSQDMTELTRMVFGLPLVHQLGASHIELSQGNTVLVAAADLLRALGQKFHQCQDFQQKMKHREVVSGLLVDLPKQVSEVTKSGSPQEVKRLYHLTGLVIKHCGTIVYVKSKPDCLLPLLLERLVLPRVLFKQGQLSPAVMDALRDTLHMFIQGISKLDHTRDLYLKRTFSDLVCQYLHRFPVKSQAINTGHRIHPFVESLSGSCGNQASSEALTLRCHMFEVIRSEFLTPRSSCVQHQSQALLLLLEVIRRTQQVQVRYKDTEILLSMCLDQALASNGGNKSVMILLQTLVESLKKISRETEPLTMTLVTFVEQHLKAYDVRVFKILETVSQHNAGLVVTSLPGITKAITSTEMIRGVGMDTRLRNGYKHILKMLGEAGEREIAAMDKLS